MSPIVVDDIDEPEVWALLKWMAERSADWVLIGELMVATFDIEYCSEGGRCDCGDARLPECGGWASP